MKNITSQVKKTAVTTFGADFGLPLATLGLIYIPAQARPTTFTSIYEPSLTEFKW